MSIGDITNITTGEARLSFVHLFKPFAGTQGQEEKFSVTVLIPKSDVDTMNRINAAIETAKQRGISDKWNGQCPPLVQNPVYDGDGVKPSDGLPFGPECKGHWVFTAGASADYPPEVVDANGNPIINQSEIYSGIYGRVNLDFYPYFFGGKKGVGCGKGLNAVQKLRDGEALSGSHVTAAQAFGAPAAQAQPQPMGYGQPTAQAAYMNTPQGMPQSQVPWNQGQPTQPQINPITGLPM